MTAKLQAYIGSTNGNIDEYRQAAMSVCRRLHIDPAAGPAEANDAEAAVRQQLERADVFIGLYTSANKAEIPALTRLEFVEAGEQGIERFCCPVQPNHGSAGQSQDGWRFWDTNDRPEAMRVLEPSDNVDSFSWKLTFALYRWMSRHTGSFRLDPAAELDHPPALLINVDVERQPFGEAQVEQLHSGIARFLGVPAADIGMKRVSQEGGNATVELHDHQRMQLAKAIDYRDRRLKEYLQPLDLSCLRVGEHFIPVRKSQLIETITRDAAHRVENIADFLQFCRLLDSTLHYEYHTYLESLKEAYVDFNPDTEDQLGGPSEASSSQDLVRGELEEVLYSELTSLLERANYRRLTIEDIQEIAGEVSPWHINLEVDFDAFERLEVYTRGITEKTLTRRRWHKFFMLEEAKVLVYERLVVIFHLAADSHAARDANSNAVYLKTFKNIPTIDLESLLPGTRVKMTLFDQGKIFVPTAAGIVMTLVKIVTAIMASVVGIFTLLAAAAGTIGYGVKSFVGWQRTKEKYQHNLTKSLLYQNLGNNAGVLFRLVNDAEEQEFREGLLAYFLLWSEAPSEGWSLDELDDAAEAYLKDKFQIDADFEVDDAAAKLMRWGLVTMDEQRRFVALPLAEALRKLDETWDNYFQYNNV